MYDNKILHKLDKTNDYTYEYRQKANTYNSHLSSLTVHYCGTNPLGCLLWPLKVRPLCFTAVICFFFFI